MPKPADRSASALIAFTSGASESQRWRSVGAQVLCAQLQVAAPPAHVQADWLRDIAQQLVLEPGDVEPLSLARARRRWPDAQAGEKAMAEWFRQLGLAGDLLASCPLSLMACRGADTHHDAAQYGHSAFCNLFLSEDCAQDLIFPQLGLRIALQRGRAVMFDTAQPHAVVARGRAAFDAAEFSDLRQSSQVFLSWEVPIEAAGVAPLLALKIEPAG